MLRILMVDDNPTALNLLRAMLMPDRYSIIEATSGSEALRLAANEKPDLVLLDTMLIDASGYQVCRRLKAQPETANIPVIMLITGSHPRLQSWRAEHGVDDYLPRPFTPQQLNDAIGKFAATPVVA